MKYTVVITLSGPLADAVALEWTDQAAPAADGTGWQPCIRLADGRWRLASRDPAHPVHWREPGPFENIAIRYRLHPEGPWSPISEDRKGIVIVAEEAPGEPGAPAVAPVLLAPPALMGSGIIGSEVTVETGLWGGEPAPALTLQWLRDGAEIAGATGPSYVPTAADDRTDLACAVTATNAAGSAQAVTAALAVRHAPPEVVGELVDEVFDEGTGLQLVETAAVFRGEALVFSVEGAGATIDPATGVVSIPTEVALAGEKVTVTATNSGGSAAASFLVTVEALEEEGELVLALGPVNAELLVARNLDPEVEGLHIGLRIVDARHPLHPAQGGAGALAWTGADPAGVPLGGGNRGVKARGFADPESANYGVWALTRRQTGTPAPWADRSNEIGASFTITAAWAPETEVAGGGLAGPTWIGWGETFPALVIAAETAPAPPPPAATGSRRMPICYEEEWQAERTRGHPIRGDGMQLHPDWSQCREHPNVIVKTQDVAGPWYSNDHGRTWWRPMSRGLLSRCSNAICLDPFDPDHWVVQMSGQFADSAGNAGLYRTTDAGRSYEPRKRGFTGLDADVRNNGIGASPTQKVGGRARRWYALTNQLERGGARDAPIYFSRSDDGAATWQALPNVPFAQFGLVRDLVCDPEDIDTFYVASARGVFRCSNGGAANPTFTQIHPWNVRRISYCEVVGGNTRLIIGNDQGIRQTNNARATSPSWSTVTNKPVAQLFVSRWEPNFMISTGREDTPEVSTNGGVTWTTVPQSALERRPGTGGNYIVARHSQSYVAFSNNPGEAVLFGDYVTYNMRNTAQRTQNYGQSWKISMGYFSGTHGQTPHNNGQNFHPKNPDIFAIGIMDGGCALTQSRGRHFRRRVGPLPGGGHNTATALAIHPDYPNKPIVVASVGRHTGGYLACTNQLNLSGWFFPGPEATQSNKQAFFIGFDLDDPSFCFWDEFRSTNHGEGNWSRMSALRPGHKVWGMTRNRRGGQALFSFDRDRTFDRSFNRGNSWSHVLTIEDASQMNKPGGANQLPFCVHPSNADRVWISAPRQGSNTFPENRTIRLYRLDEGTPANRPFTAFDVLAGLEGDLVPGARFYLERFVVDWRHPDTIWYATNWYPGTGVSLVRTTNGGKSWENLSHLVPEGSRTYTDVSPVTGDLISCSPMGTFVIPPPYEEANAIYNVLTQPNRILGPQR